MTDDWVNQANLFNVGESKFKVSDSGSVTAIRDEKRNYNYPLYTVYILNNYYYLYNKSVRIGEGFTQCKY